MNTVLRIFLSMSVSGALLIFVLFLTKWFWQDKISRQWQYYIWLIVILRLILPFAPEINFMRTVYQAIELARIQDFSATRSQTLSNIVGNKENATISLTQDSEKMDGLTERKKSEHIFGNNALPHATIKNKISRYFILFQNIVMQLVSHLWLIWLAGVFGMLIRKVTVYQDFVRYIKAGGTLVSDIETLERVSLEMEQIGMKKPVELCVNPSVLSPMLIGFFHPCIVLPDVDICEKDFHYIIIHELIHHRRRDVLYKWLVQVTVCLHWFNPMVYLMSREITKACEFSCDEAVLTKVGEIYASDYGKTLLDAMAAVGKCRDNFGIVLLSQNKQLLKERLCAIMKFRKRSKPNTILTSILTLSILFGAVFVGVYPVAAAQPDTIQENHLQQTIFTQNSLEENNISTNKSSRNNLQENSDLQENNSKKEGKNSLETYIKQYYETGSLPLFQIAFVRLDEEAKGEWLEQIYADGKIAFFGAAVSQLECDSVFIQQFAQKTYADGSIDFFSIIAKQMSEKALKSWLDRALTDQQVTFQIILFELLEADDEWNDLKDAFDKQFEEAQIQEYLKQGIISDGKTYYYESHLVNIFLDIRKDSSFYTLQINPQGTINIKVTRDKDGDIESVDYMTDAEVEVLLGDMKEEDLIE